MFMRNEYAFLSNFYPCEIQLDGLTYQSAEAAYQAQKEKNRFFREPYQFMNPVEAKLAGKTAVRRKDWDEVKEQVMYDVLKAKFDQNEGFIDLLLAVKEPIVEDNTWNDTFWGRYNGVGENRLGLLLERLKSEYREVIGNGKG